MSIKKIFLLGATGQVGKELAYELKEIENIDVTCHSRAKVKSSFFNFHNIKNIIGNLDDRDIIKQINAADLIFDLAAPNNGTLKEIKKFYKNRADIVISNMKKNSKIVFASTMNAYGIDKKRKKLKNYFISSSIYSSNKRFAENYYKKLGKKNNINVYSLRLGEVHGKFQRASRDIIKLIEDKRIFEIPKTPAWVTFISLIKQAIINILFEKEKPGLYTVVCDDVMWFDLLNSFGRKINIKPKYIIKDMNENSNKLINLLFNILSSYKDIFRGNFEISKDYENLLKLNYRINKVKNSFKETDKLKIYKDYNRYVGILPGKRLNSLKYNKDQVLENLII